MNVNKFTTFYGLLCSLLAEEAYWTWTQIREAPSESRITWRSREWSWCSVEMARLKRTAERIREEAAEGIAKSLEGLPTWKPEHGEKVEKGIVELKLWLMRDRLDKLWSGITFLSHSPMMRV